MPDEAPLDQWPTGLVPESPGWFVVNVRDVAWAEHPRQGYATLFENPRGEPVALLAVGARHDPERLRYPVSELAARYGASVATETTDPDEAYAGEGEWDLGRPDGRFPWS